jgi:hypothetical protein
MVDDLGKEVAQRWAAKIIPFEGKPKGPTLAIGGIKYALSTYSGGLIGDLENHGTQDPKGEGAKLILGPMSNKWKYLWVLNVDRKVLCMWRASDGNEKHYGSSYDDGVLIAKLDQKKQLNRVSDEQFLRIEVYMEEQARDNLVALRKYVENNESDYQKQVNSLSWEYYRKRIEPTLSRKIEEAHKGVLPFGFRHNPSNPRDKVDQAIIHLIGELTSKELTPEKVDTYLRSKGLDVDNNDGQASYWAVNDIRDALYDKYIR